MNYLDVVVTRIEKDYDRAREWTREGKHEWVKFTYNREFTFSGDESMDHMDFVRFCLESKGIVLPKNSPDYSTIDDAIVGLFSDTSRLRETVFELRNAIVGVLDVSGESLPRSKMSRKNYLDFIYDWLSERGLVSQRDTHLYDVRMQQDAKLCGMFQTAAELEVVNTELFHLVETKNGNIVLSSLSNDYLIPLP